MEKEQIPLKEAEIGLLGDTNVGKYSLCQTYIKQEFHDHYYSRIGTDKFDKKIILDNGKEIKLILWATNGQERFRSISLQTIKNATGIVLVADLTNKRTFENINIWLQKIKNKFDNPCVVLFGNKADLKEKMEISSEEAKKYAEKNGLIYFETSAKTKQGINEGFSYIANQAYKIAEQNLIKRNSTKSKSKCSIF